MTLSNWREAGVKCLGSVRTKQRIKDKKVRVSVARDADMY
jgi:DNA replication protein DnaD